ncbi:MAG: response regulator [Candidatus Doudnabacteria bacterium]|nr:response regulator [Candidatus Doudnabacteria bacterium]
MIRILFAHPDQKLSSLYSQRMQEHFNVDSVHDGLSALRRIRLQTPSIIISEYYLPLLSGITLLKFVRSNSNYSAVPFIFLTEHNDNTGALSLGANDWLDSHASHPNMLLDRIYHHLKLNKHAIQVY